MVFLDRSIPQFYQTILNSIADGVYTVDLDWRVTSFNRAAETITGISRTEAIGKPCFEVFRSNVCERGCFLRQAMAEGRVAANQSVYVVRPDKKQIAISVTAAVLMDDDDRIIGGVMTFRDLTALNHLQKALRKQFTFGDIVSKNRKMLEIFSILPQIARSRTTVLIEGPSGTGKELIARALHHHSLQAEGPFVAVNCGALPDTLIESELFGYKSGAFTDAKKDKPGRFAQAQNGTLLLDEIGDISPAVQVKLLRVLETRKYEPLGAVRSLETNVRIVAATHRDLEQQVKNGKFREDLYYRINVVRLSLPPLVDRKEDIPLLADHFINHFNQLYQRQVPGISREALSALMLYDWPGNVRELENAIEHAFVLCREGLIRMEHLPERVRPRALETTAPTGLTLKEMERHAIRQALDRNDWKKVKTAGELGINKNTLRRKILRLGIKP